MHQKDLKKLEQNNNTIALNILYVPCNIKQISLACKSKYSRKHENLVILLMITDGEKWYYLAVKNLSRLLRGITSNHNGDLYCLNCFHSYCTDNKLKKHEKVCNEDDYCYPEMPNEDNKILEHNHGEKSLKVQFIIYVDLECLLQKMRSFMNNLEKSYTEIEATHEPSGGAMTVKFSFDVTKNKYDYYRERDCIKKLCEKLKDRAMEIINYQEKEMILLTDKENESHEKQKVCHICKKEFCLNENQKNEFKLCQKVKDHCHYTGKLREAPHSICNLKYKAPKEIPVIVHNGSTYDYHFIIK